MIAVTIDEFTPCLKNMKTGEIVETRNTRMSIMEAKKKYDDSAVDIYLKHNDIYNSSDLCIDIAAVIRYAREHGIALSSVPQEIIDQYTESSSQMVG